MTVAAPISLQIVRKELEACQKDIEIYGWIVSEIIEKDQYFAVKMKSPIDKERYIVRMAFDNYREHPLMIDFVDPESGVIGTRHAYPKSIGDNGGFFNVHNNIPVICHPCSRKAYTGFTAIHGDWEIAGWQENPKINTLLDIRTILLAIYYRISNSSSYGGRMDV